MSDRTSAEIFGNIFEFLAKLKKNDQVSMNDIDEMAQWLYKQSKQYDFSDDQMYADDALKIFGLYKEPKDD